MPRVPHAKRERRRGAGLGRGPPPRDAPGFGGAWGPQQPQAVMDTLYGGGGDGGGESPHDRRRVVREGGQAGGGGGGLGALRPGPGRTQATPGAQAAAAAV